MARVAPAFDPTGIQHDDMSRGDVINLDVGAILAHRPEVAAGLAGAMDALRRGTVGQRTCELIRLRIAFHNQCRSCMAVRYPESIDDGLTEDLVCSLERPLGVVVTLGGQTPLRLAHDLAAAGVPLLGDPLPAIDAAEDRGKFAALLEELELRAPRWGVADTRDEALAVAEQIGYPVLVRPHYVLGGRRMRVVRSADELELHEPSLVDEFLGGALELDVDARVFAQQPGHAAGLMPASPPASSSRGRPPATPSGPRGVAPPGR